MAAAIHHAAGLSTSRSQIGKSRVPVLVVCLPWSLSPSTTINTKVETAPKVTIQTAFVQRQQVSRFVHCHDE
jgi:hypothetical protein